MKTHELRVTVTKELYIKYKTICLEKDLSLPKQTAALIRLFVDCREEDKKNGAK